MRTLILAYLISFMGLVMAGGGVWGLFRLDAMEILRNGIRNDIWRHCHAWNCAGLAPASRNNPRGLVIAIG